MIRKEDSTVLFALSFLLLFLDCFAATDVPAETFEHVLDISGYVNCKLFYDTRQIVAESAENQQVDFYPQKKQETPTGDINAHGQGQMLPIETRIRFDLRSPELKPHVEAKGIIEVEFRGTADVVNIINMRHAYGQLNIGNSTLIFGQTWHPFDVVELIPNTVAFNEGRPFAIYDLAPQITYMYHASSLDIIASATSQVDFVSDGPIGPSQRYMRDAIVPNLHFQLKGFFGDHIAGAGIDYQRIAPRLVSDTGYKVREDLSSVAGLWYLGLKWQKVEINNTLIFGGNLSNYGLIGGYAVQRGSTNPITGKRRYTSTRTLAAWSDWTINPTEFFSTGFFFGADKNCGSAKKIVPTMDVQDHIIPGTIFGRGNDVDTVFRISPRLIFKVKQMVFALEVEYTRAAYGIINEYAKVVDTVPVGNTQILFSTFLFF